MQTQTPGSIHKEEQLRNSLTNPIKGLARLFLSLLLGGGIFVSHVHAVTRVWSGGASVNPNSATVGANWQPVGVPASGDSIRFDGTYGGTTACHMNIGTVQISSMIIDVGFSSSVVLLASATITGDFLQNSISTVTASNQLVEFRGNFNNSTPGARFYMSGATFTFNSAGAQSITGNQTGPNTGFPSINIVNTGAVTFQNSMKFFNFTDLTSGSTLFFMAGSTTTVNSSINLTPGGGPNIQLRSTSPGTQYFWNLTPGGASGQYLDVQDCVVSGLTFTVPNSVNSGNNVGWIFSSGGGGTTTVLNPLVSNVSSTTVSFIWLTVTGSSYTAVLSTVSGFSSNVSSVTLPAHTTTFYGLTPQSTYYFEVKISTEGDISYSSPISTVTPLNSQASTPTVAIQNPLEVAYQSGSLTLSNLTTISGTAQDNISISKVDIRISISSSCAPPGCTGAGSTDWNGANWAPAPIWLNVFNNASISQAISWSYPNGATPPPWQNGFTYDVRARATNSSNITNNKESNGNLAYSSFTFSASTASIMAINNLVVTAGFNPGQVNLSWSAPNVNGGAGYNYDIRWSSFGPINSQALFSAANSIQNPPTNFPPPLPTPAAPGTTQQITVNNLSGGVTVWFAIETDNSSIQWSPPSNSPGVLPPAGATSASNTSIGSAKVVASLPFNDNVSGPAGPPYEPQSINCPGFASGAYPAVYYKYVSTATLSISANTIGSGGNQTPIMQVWNDPFSASTNSVATACTGNKVNFNTMPGITYYVENVYYPPFPTSVSFSLSQYNNVQPSVITTLGVSPGTNNGQVNLTWTEMDDGTGQKVASYEIRYSSLGPVNISNWTAPWISSGGVLDVRLSPVSQTVLPTPVGPGNVINYTVANLNVGATYWFAVSALNSAGNISNPSNSPFTYANLATSAGDGGGSVQIQDVGGNALSSLPVSSQTTLNIVYTVGTNSLQGGATVSITFPYGWTIPTSSTLNIGSVTVSAINSSIATLSNLSLNLDTQNNVYVTLAASAKMNPGDTFTVKYQNGFTQWNIQNGVQFTVKTKGSSTGNLMLIASQPVLNMGSGGAANVGFADFNIITMGSGQTSPGMLLQPKDSNWNTTTANKNLNVRIFTLYWDTNSYTYKPDYTAQISTLSPFTNISLTANGNGQNTNNWSGAYGTTFYYPVTIPNGASNLPIYYQSSRVGSTVLWIEWNNDFAVGPSTNSTSRWFTILSGNIGFSGLSAKASNSGSGTITPDGSGYDDHAIIKFTPSDPTIQWHVRVGTDPVFSNLSSIAGLNIGGGGYSAGNFGVSQSTINEFLDWWGAGIPPGQGVFWYGQDFTGSVVGSGTYIVRLEDSGGTVVSTTTINVNSSWLDVVALKPDGVTAAGNASVSVNGQSGQGYVYRTKQTGSNGKARVWGLKSGVSYTVTVNYFDPSAQKSYSGILQNQTAGNPPPAISTVTFGNPATIRFHATLPAGAVYSWDQWGSLNVNDVNSGFQSAFGSLHFTPGSADSDSGWSFNGLPSSWTIVTVQPGSYKIYAQMPGFSNYSATLSNLTAGSSTDVTFQFMRRPKIFGYVLLPSTQTYGVWVSVEGTKVRNGVPDSFPTAWGGAWIQGVNDPGSGGVGKTTGTFQMDVDTANSGDNSSYIIRARAFGLGTVSSATMVSNSGIGTILNGNIWDGSAVIQNGLNLNFPPPSVGITGTITIVGNTTKLANSNPWLVQGSSFTLWLNAFNQSNNAYAGTQVLVPMSTSPVTANYRIPGLDDGTYQVFTWLQGFDVVPPGPKIAVVSGGTGNLNLTLSQYSGAFTGLFNISPNTDLNNISLSVTGPNISFSTPALCNPGACTQALSNLFLTGNSTGYSVNGLGSGFYTANAFYKTNGQSKSFNLEIINGQTSTETFTLNSQVFTVSGTVKVSPFTFGQTSTHGGITINNVSDLANPANISTETLNVGGNNITLPIARIEAYPRDQSNFNSGIRDLVSINGGNVGGFGLGSIQLGFGQVKYSSITSQGTWAINNLPPGIYVLRHPVNLNPGATYYNLTPGSFEVNGPSVGNEEKTIQITNTGVVQVLDPPGGDLNFTYSQGASISGQISLPSNIASDTRFLTLLLQDSKREIVSWQSVYLNGASANYNVSNVGDGDYTLLLNDEQRGNQDNPDTFSFGLNYPKYLAKPLRIKITGGGSVSNQNIQLYRSCYMQGKLNLVHISSDGTRTSELITSNNANRLPSSFNISAYSDSIGRGITGNASQNCQSGAPGVASNCTLSIDSVKGTFLIFGLFPDVTYKVDFGQNSWDSNTLGQGKINVVRVRKSGLSVSAGQTLDLGVIDLKQGVTLTGSVSGPRSGSDSTLIPIPDIKVSAKPVGANGGDDSFSAFTDAQGSFTLSGLSPDLRYYDLFFDRRGSGDNLIDFAAAGLSNIYAQKVKKSVDVSKSSIPVNVVLDLGLGSISGQVTTSDGGRLQDPFSLNGGIGFPIAQIVVNKVGDVPSDNPLGDIEVKTDGQGNYTVDRLAAGTYNVYALSLGYPVQKITVTVGTTNSPNNNITLVPGLSLSGSIAKTDGTKPTTGDINQIVAASPDFQNLVIGSLNTNGQTGTIDGYTIAGMKSGVTYDVVFFNESFDPILPPENNTNNGCGGAAGICISTNVSNFNLTFAQSAPKVFMKGRKVGIDAATGRNQYKIKFESTQALRNQTSNEQSDGFWSQVVSISSFVGGSTGGSISQDPTDTNPLDPSRKKLGVLFVPDANQTKVTFNFQTFTEGLQPGTSSNFLENVSFDYFLGLDGQQTGRINPAQGGSLTLEGDQSGVAIPAGAFQDPSGNLLSLSSSVSFGIQKALNVNTATTTVAQSSGGVAGAPAFNPQVSTQTVLNTVSPILGLPPILGRAIQAMNVINPRTITVKQGTSAKGAPAFGAPALAQQASDVASSVLGAFYDFLLPAGVNRQLKSNATITLQYSTAADSSLMNVYFYNDSGSTMCTTSGNNVTSTDTVYCPGGGNAVFPGGYGLENTGKVVDSTNSIITVQTNHFTVFVVVNATSPTLGAGATIVSGGGSSTTTATTQAFTPGTVNLVTLTLGTTQPISGIPVSGGGTETHSFTLISTGTNNTGIVLNVQSVLQAVTFSGTNVDKLVDFNGGTAYSVDLKITGIAGNQATLSIAGLYGLGLPTTIAYTGTTIDAFNFPNPFNASARGFLFTGTKTSSQQTLYAQGSTVIRYALPSILGASPVHVSLEIYNVAGELIKRKDFGTQTPGFYYYNDWDGRNENGDTVASGVYLGRIAVDGSGLTKIFKMAVLK